MRRVLGVLAAALLMAGPVLAQPAPPPGKGADGCPKGQLYDGTQCRPESEVLAGLKPIPDPPKPAPRVKTKPRVYVFPQAGEGRDRAVACVDEAEVTVCKPVP
jgi:hypothetical protein